MKNTQFGREKYGLLFYIKIKSFSAPENSKKLSDKLSENCWMQKSLMTDFLNVSNF